MDAKSIYIFVSRWTSEIECFAFFCLVIVGVHCAGKEEKILIQNRLALNKAVKRSATRRRLYGGKCGWLRMLLIARLAIDMQWHGLIRTRLRTPISWETFPDDTWVVWDAEWVWVWDFRNQYYGNLFWMALFFDENNYKLVKMCVVNYWNLKNFGI